MNPDDPDDDDRVRGDIIRLLEEQQRQFDNPDSELRERLRAQARETHITDTALNETIRVAAGTAFVVAFFAALLGDTWAWAYLAYVVAFGAYRLQVARGDAR
ncbi:MAG: hypothetical protein ACT4PY_14070, partial [Armatimonadota bacterium]